MITWSRLFEWVKLLFYGFLTGAVEIEKAVITKLSNFRNH